MARFYLENYANVRTLLVMISLPDFGNCTTEPEELVAPDDAARYAFGGWPAVYFYFRYVSPQRYLKTAMTLAGRRMPLTGDLHLDAYGSSPLQVPDIQKRGLRYGEIANDPACVAALEGLIDDTLARGAQFALVFPPIHPDYRALYPADVAWLAGVADHVAAKGKREEGKIVVLDMIHDPSFAKNDFFDAFHLQWNAVKALSVRIAASLEVSVAPGKNGHIAKDAERWASKPRQQENKQPN